MDTYQRVKDYLTAWLTLAYGYDDQTMPEFQPGPPSAKQAADTVGPTVVLTAYAGPGLALEGQVDRVGWGVDVAGDQGDYDGCEELARQIDRGFVVIEWSVEIGGVLVHGVSRAGGRPQVTGRDDRERWHASCSYVVTVQSGVYA